MLVLLSLHKTHFILRSLAAASTNRQCFVCPASDVLLALRVCGQDEQDETNEGFRTRLRPHSVRLFLSLSTAHSLPSGASLTILNLHPRRLSTTTHFYCVSPPLSRERIACANNENVFFLLLCCYSVYFEILKISIIKKFGLEFDVILHFPHSGIPTSHKASNRRCRERIACAMHTNRDLDKSAVG